MKLGIVGKPSVHELFVLEHFITFQSAQKKYTESEIIDIQTELDEKIKHTPPNRVLNADEMGITTNCSKTVGYCRVDEKMIKKVPDQRQLGMKKRKLNFDHDGTYQPCEKLIFCNSVLFVSSVLFNHHFGFYETNTKHTEGQILR